MKPLVKKIAGFGAIIALLPSALTASRFDSGSTGIDGALIYADHLGIVVFDPDDFDPVLDLDRDGIYHFTDIHIGHGTEVQLRADVLGHKPVIWLASGDVTIEGVLDLSARQTHPELPAIPGAGGFYGGSIVGARDGQGPGGGAGVDASNDYVNPFLIPLIGASGSAAEDYHAGSSGGGALMIASSGTVRLDGEMWAWDTYGSAPGRGNIRIIANEIAGHGMFIGVNVLRLEAFQHNFSGRPGDANVILARPGGLFPRSPIRIAIVDGAPVEDRPGASKHTPDVIINNGGATIIEVHCSQVPLGKRVRVVGWNETIGRIEAITGPLEGTLEESSASCEMVIPPGNTTFMAQVLWED